MRSLAWSKRTRNVLASVGFMAAGLLTGCQGGPPIIRGDGTNMPVATAPAVQSPAFAQVAAGQALPQGPQMMAQSRMPNQPLMAGQPIVGSGGAVYPVNYGQQPTMVPQPNMVAAPAPVMVQQPPMMAQPPVGQTIVGVVQTPTGPQYVYSDASTPTPTAPIVNNIPPVTIPPATTVPTAPATVNPVPNYVTPVGGTPTFVAPPPTTIPLPTLHTPAPMAPASPSFAPSETSGTRAPEMLPPTVTVKPTGVALPTPLGNPTLGSFPAVPSMPVTTIPAGAKVPSLPAVTKPIDDDIPEAPIFVPGSR